MANQQIAASVAVSSLQTKAGAIIVLTVDSLPALCWDETYHSKLANSWDGSMLIATRLSVSILKVLNTRILLAYSMSDNKYFNSYKTSTLKIETCQQTHNP